LKKQRQQLKILLLQVRADKETKEEEYQAFVQFSGLEPHQIDCLNCYEDMAFRPNIIEGYDALFVGGSSDASVRKPRDFPFVVPAQALIRYCYDENIPVLASCFGFQLAVQELGGQVIIDEDNMEMGMMTIQLNQTHQIDPLLYDYPNEFWAVSGHKERALSLPKDTLTIGVSHLCPYHIIVFKEKPFYGFQFHPEIDRAVLNDRLSRYHSRYLKDEQQIEQVMKNAHRDTSVSNRIIHDFVDRIILNH
jgi:GMP synthase (glutamine-hydrolysing)